MSRVAEKPLARLTFGIAVSEEAFAAEYERRLAPILHRYGLVKVEVEALQLLAEEIL